MKHIEVLIYEDNQDMRDGLAQLINRTEGLALSGAFADCMAAEAQVKKLQPDVILMDIDLPGITGIQAVQLIRHFDINVQILMLTVFDTNEKIFDALCAGASGYILKNDPPHKYLEAINEVYSGGAPISASVAKKMLGFFSNKNVILTTPGQTDYHLTDREKELLKLMVEGNNYRTLLKNHL